MLSFLDEARMKAERKAESEEFILVMRYEEPGRYRLLMAGWRIEDRLTCRIFF
jgi:hypothetical protein